MVVKEKYIMNSPVIYRDIIRDHIKDDENMDCTKWINEAIKQRIVREIGSLEPKSVWHGDVEDMPL